MTKTENHTPHSAQVQMQLLIGEAVFSITQMGPDFLFIKEPVNHPPATGAIVLQVDARVRRWNVRLPDGMSARSDRVAIAAAE